jgi:hypothetical protein
MNPATLYVNGYHYYSTGNINGKFAEYSRFDAGSWFKLWRHESGLILMDGMKDLAFDILALYRRAETLGASEVAKHLMQAHEATESEVLAE